MVTGVLCGDLQLPSINVSISREKNPSGSRNLFSETINLAAQQNEWQTEKLLRSHQRKKTGPYGTGTITSRVKMHFDSLDELADQAQGAYTAILIDCPWCYDRDLTHSSAGGMTYNKMSLDELKALPVGQLANPECCLLFMWATMPKLPQALEVMNAWGFTYCTTAFVWVKTRGPFLYSGLGTYTRSNVEIVLLGRKGRCPPLHDIRTKQLIIEPVREHSQKPDVIRKYITDLVGDVPRIEMFARFVPPGDPSGRQESLYTEGWDSWGDGDFGQPVVQKPTKDRGAATKRNKRHLDGRSQQEAFQAQVYQTPPWQWEPPLTDDDLAYYGEQAARGDPEPLVVPPWLEYNPDLMRLPPRPPKARGRSFSRRAPL